MSERTAHVITPPLRVLYVDTAVQSAGGQVSLVETLRLLDPSKVVPIVCSPAAGGLRSYCADSGIRWIPLAFSSTHLSPEGRQRPGRLGGVAQSTYGLACLVASMRRAGADIVHANSFKAGLACAIASRIARKPMVFHDRTLGGHMPLGLVVGSAARRIIAVSVAVTAKYGGRFAGKMRVIPDGIDTDRFHATRTGTCSPGSVAYLGRISREKGLLHLARCAPSVLERVPGVRFLIGGVPLTAAGEAYLKSVRAEIECLGVSGAFTFAGQVDDARAFLSEAEMLALPSEQEGLGIVMLESMALGRPVVAFASGGPQEVISTGRDGLLVPPGDVQGLADAIVALLTDPGLRRGMGEAARRKVVDRFSSAAATARLTEVYLEICPAGRSA
jgi:glycosyltransferase involved in cell wall biosynthesis